MIIHQHPKPPEAERPESRRQRPVGIRDLTGTKMVRHRSPQVYAKNVSITDRDSNGVRVTASRGVWTGPARDR